MMIRKYIKICTNTCQLSTPGAQQGGVILVFLYEMCTWVYFGIQCCHFIEISKAVIVIISFLYIQVGTNKYCCFLFHGSHKMDSQCHEDNNNIVFRVVTQWFSNFAQYVQDRYVVKYVARGWHDIYISSMLSIIGAGPCIIDFRYNAATLVSILHSAARWQW